MSIIHDFLSYSPQKLIVNQMLLKHRAKLRASQKAMEETQIRMQEERGERQSHQDAGGRAAFLGRVF